MSAHKLCVVLQAGMYPEAAKAAVRVTDPIHTKHVGNLLAVIAFEQENLPGKHSCCKTALMVQQVQEAQTQGSCGSLLVC